MQSILKPIRRAAQWVGRNPNTTGLVLLALAAQSAEHDQLATAAVVTAFVGRAIVTAAEIVRSNEG